MPHFYIIIFSITFYAILIWIISKKYQILLVNFRQWPQHPTLFILWVMWLIFLLLFAPLSYQETDMTVWRTSIENLLLGKLLPESYVYLPSYAQLLSAIVWPFHYLGWDTHLLIVYTIKWFVIFSYMACAIMMSKLIPHRSDLAPLGIVIAPVTIFYLFFGTNHIVMLFFLLLALTFIKKGRWVWVGFFAAFSCYKFLMAPTFIVLLFIILIKYGIRPTLLIILGAAIFFIPSLTYYFYDNETLIKIFTNQAAIGGHAHHIEPFHFLNMLSNNIKGFERWYLENKIWFFLSISGIPISLFLYKFKKVNFPQCLALSYAFVAIFALEPFRLEPLIGLLWLDAIYREDLRLQIFIFTILFLHAVAWYEIANFSFLVFDPATPPLLWESKGLLLGLAIIFTFLFVIFNKDKKDFFFLTS